MFKSIKQWFRDANFGWKDAALILVFSISLMLLTNHVTQHVCFCDN